MIRVLLISSEARYIVGVRIQLEVGCVVSHHPNRTHSSIGLRYSHGSSSNVFHTRGHSFGFLLYFVVHHLWSKALRFRITQDKTTPEMSLIQGFSLERAFMQPPWHNSRSRPGSGTGDVTAVMPTGSPDRFLMYLIKGAGRSTWHTTALTKKNVQ
jgi:hypothetical protein